MPPGDAQPLHVLMTELLRLSGVQVSPDPSAIFDWISRDVPLFEGMDYEAIGPSGTHPVQTPQEVLR